MMSKTYPAGLHYGMPEDEYHADPMDRPSLSSSLARLVLNRSPLHAWTAHPRLNPEWEPTEKKAFDIGRAAHRKVLGVGADYVAIPSELLSDDGGVRTKPAKEWAAEAREAGLTPLKTEEVALIDRIAEAVNRKMDAMRMTLDPACSEVTVLNEIDGCPVRARVDNAPDGKPYLIDLKTTRDASPDGCIRAITEYGLDVQIAHYLDTWRAATGEDRTFRLVFVEKEPPFGCGVVQLYAAKPGASEDQMAVDWMADGRGKVAYAREIWRDCLLTNEWPGYPDQIATVGAPGWYRNKWDAYPGAPRPDMSKPSAQALRAAREMQAPERMKA